MIQAAASSEARIGELLVAEGLITDVQLQEVLRTQHDRTSYVPLGQLLVERKYITRRQLDLVLDRGEKRPRLGEVLIRSGLITAEQLEHALEQQKSVKLPLGQVLIKLGYVSDDAMRQAGRFSRRGPARVNIP